MRTDAPHLVGSDDFCSFGHRHKIGSVAPARRGGWSTRWLWGAFARLATDAKSGRSLRARGVARSRGCMGDGPLRLAGTAPSAATAPTKIDSISWAWPNEQNPSLPAHARWLALRLREPVDRSGAAVQPTHAPIVHVTTGGDGLCCSRPLTSATHLTSASLRMFRSFGHWGCRIALAVVSRGCSVGHLTPDSLLADTRPLAFRPSPSGGRLGKPRGDGAVVVCRSVPFGARRCHPPYSCSQGLKGG